jgi:hypothetical protein
MAQPSNHFSHAPKAATLRGFARSDRFLRRRVRPLSTLPASFPCVSGLLCKPKFATRERMPFLLKVRCSLCQQIKKAKHPALLVRHGLAWRWRKIARQLRFSGLRTLVEWHCQSLATRQHGACRTALSSRMSGSSGQDGSRSSFKQSSTQMKKRCFTFDQRRFLGGLGRRQNRTTPQPCWGV